MVEMITLSDEQVRAAFPKAGDVTEYRKLFERPEVKIGFGFSIPEHDGLSIRTIKVRTSAGARSAGWRVEWSKEQRKVSGKVVGRRGGPSAVSSRAGRRQNVAWTARGLWMCYRSGY